MLSLQNSLPLFCFLLGLDESRCKGQQRWTCISSHVLFLCGLRIIDFLSIFFNFYIITKLYSISLYVNIYL
ncbi:hypothetical protein J3Q64DRAFT_1754392 [Phycomyces blakesleeanus]|uniref:Uncharacterized protein n=1 Tax=Phycomyces blakesleeanus TaxID=4837 RepID=A0ABR3AUC5_PHYBL